MHENHIQPDCSIEEGYRVMWKPYNDPLPVKTTISKVDRTYNFSGYLVLSHQPIATTSSLIYSSGLARCRINFHPMPIPNILRPNNTERSREAFMWLENTVFYHILGLELSTFLNHISSQINPKETEKVKRGCYDFHTIPLFVRSEDAHKLPNIATTSSVVAIPSNIRYLSLEGIAEHLNHVVHSNVADFLSSPNCSEDFMKGQIVVSSDAEKRLAYRIDGVVNGELVHTFEGSEDFDIFIRYKTKREKWRKIAPLMEEQLYLEAENCVFAAENCSFTGLACDMTEICTAMPVILKSIQYAEHLAKLESVIGYRIRTPGLLRRAMTHASYSELNFGTVNIHEAVRARSRTGQVYKSRRSSVKRKEIDSIDSDDSEDVEEGEIEEEGDDSFRPTIALNEKHQSYEQIEFLGDAILSHIVASWVFFRFPLANEHKLSSTRSSLVNNEFLASMALKIGLHEYVLTGFKVDSMPESVKVSILADCFEAILGVLYIEHGIEQCREFYGKALKVHDPELHSLMWLSEEEIQKRRKCYMQDQTLPEEHEYFHDAFDMFKSKVKIDISNILLWIQGITHKSYLNHVPSKNYFLTQDPTYERLEFLGDSVLQMLVSKYIFHNFPFLSEHHLTVLRSSLVSNRRLGGVGRELGIEICFIRLGLMDERVASVLNEWHLIADVFESMLSIILIEQGIQAVDDFLSEKLYPYAKEAIRNKEWLSPKLRLKQFLKLWCRRRKVRYYLNIDDIASTGPSHVPLHSVAVKVNNVVVARAKAGSKSEAINLGCKKALLMLGYGIREV